MIYLQNGYACMHDIMNDKQPFIFCIGPRGTGKTYGALLEVLSQKKRIIYLRRTQTEMNLITSEITSPFKHLLEDHPEITPVQVKKIADNLAEFYQVENEQENIVGYIAALSTFANIRGVDFSDVGLILYDEFIPEKRSRPIKEEYEALMNMYETTNRNRELEGKDPIKLICLANSNDIANPIFMGLGVVNRVAKMMLKETCYYSDPAHNLAIYMLQRSPISARKKETVLYQLTRGSDFERMAISNIFALDRSAVRGMPLQEYKPLVSLGELLILKHKSRDEYYARCGKPNGTCEVEFTTSDMDQKRFRLRFAYLYAAYLSGNVIFEDEASMILFEKIFK